MKFILRMLVSAGALFGVAYLSDQALLRVDSFWPAAVIAAVVLAFANAIIKPVAKILTLPITILTLGLFGLVINAVILYLVAALVEGVHTTGLWQTIVAALLIAVVSGIGAKLIDHDR
ncbi:MAG: phage holin family protein [Coriobacteriia bacterium]|nr:phage holin family protein [Coriobacteriia bacterium]